MVILNRAAHAMAWHARRLHDDRTCRGPASPSDWSECQWEFLAQSVALTTSQPSNLQEC